MNILIKLATLNNFKLSKKQINSANKVIYILECLNYLTNFGNIFPIQRKKINNKYVFLTEEVYLKKLIENLSKKTLTDDLYYKYLKKTIND